ncbi:hypothetical protein LTR96_004682 [Exophiala xenobiotica]|nr:hypothetical protein LTR41_002946 [Exophiala xenobiotica]KAK5233585.1 hypothetical protein LTR47_005208 [Exophiala xenobiotica]KAK5270181.1 hypothetical protein LTR96_004682 [Exophiala xenobiotica]KAK5340302.1 hypothetical protein LTR98_003424 [Exophiala xenobiotica]KAK5379574.1 hypothetical protein LTS03_004454 [Exophiala xenobiotica]
MALLTLRQCDQTRPTCKNCLKGNRPCPGYDTDLRIHDEGNKLRRRFGQKDVTHIKSDTESSSPATSGHSQSTGSSPDDSLELASKYGTPVSDSGSYRSNLLLAPRNAAIGLLDSQIYPDSDLLGFGSTATSPRELLSGGSINFDVPFQMILNDSIYSPYLAQEQLLNTFSSAISATGTAIIPRQMHNHTRWLSQLPAMFGSKLLDAAVRAVSLIHLSRVHQSEAFEQESRRFYGKALRLLNEALSDNVTGMSTETLSATILLSFYEMFASDSNQSWVRHAGGASTLMRIRGPSRHLSGADRDLYLAYRHTIYIEAFQRDEACFLCEPEWLDLARQIHENLRQGGSMAPERMEIFDLAEEFYMQNVFIPTTCRDALRRSKLRQVLTPDEFRAYEESIRARCRQHRASLKSINLRFRAAMKRIGLETTILQTSDPVFPMQYSYVTVFVGSTHVGYFTIMIILNLILKEIETEHAPMYIMENRELALEVCRTTSYMLTSSFLGPFFIIFALRLCLMVLEPGVERDWVVKKLRQIGNTHMKMAADIPDMKPEKKMEEVMSVDPSQFDINWDDIETDLAQYSLET